MIEHCNRFRSACARSAWLALVIARRVLGRAPAAKGPTADDWPRPLVDAAGLWAGARERLSGPVVVYRKRALRGA